MPATETPAPLSSARVTFDFARRAREIEQEIEKEAQSKTAGKDKPPESTTPPAEPAKTAEPPKKEESAKPAAEPAKTEPTKPAEPAAPAKTPEEEAKELEEQLKKPSWERTAEPKKSKAWTAHVEADRKRQEALIAERDELRKKLEGERDAIVKEKDALSKQIEAYRGYVKPDELKELTKERDALKKELEETTNRLRVLDLQQDPKFKGYFESEVNTRINRAKNIVGAEKASIVETVLRLPDGPQREQQLEDLIADLPPWKQARMANVVEELTAVELNRQAEIDKWKSKGSELEATRKAKETEEREQQLRQAAVMYDEIAATLSADDTVKPFVDDQIWQLAKKAVLTGIDDKKELVAVIARGYGYRKALEVIDNLRKTHADSEAAWDKERTELQEQLAALQKAQPQGGQPATTAAAAQAVDEDAIAAKGKSPNTLNAETTKMVSKWMNR